jgi:hypothetical protein
MTAYTESIITLAEYRAGKNKLVDERQQLNETLTEIERTRSSIFEPLKAFLNEAKQAGILAERGSEQQRLDFFKKVASNPNVFNRELRFEPRGAWRIVLGQRSFAQDTVAPDISGAPFPGETRDVLLKRSLTDTGPTGSRFSPPSSNFSETIPPGSDRGGFPCPFPYRGTVASLFSRSSATI